MAALDGDVDLSTLSYQWFASGGQTQTGGSSWRGTAVSTKQITVIVSNPDDGTAGAADTLQGTLNVGARTWGVVAASTPPDEYTPESGRTTWCRALQNIFRRYRNRWDAPGAPSLGREADIRRGLRYVDEALRDLPGNAQLFKEQ